MHIHYGIQSEPLLFKHLLIVGPWNRAGYRWKGQGESNCFATVCSHDAEIYEAEQLWRQN